MAAGGDYSRNRRLFKNISGQLIFTASTDDTTLVTNGSTNNTIYIQKIYCSLTTATAATISFEDSAGAPVRVAYVDGAVGTNAPWSFDFGAEGAKLTEGKNFVMNVSATGNAGRVVWEGYERLTAVTNA